MKEQFYYLLGTDEEIRTHLRGIGAKNFREQAEQDLHQFCFLAAGSGDVPLMMQIITRYPIILTHINTYFTNTYTVLGTAALHEHPEMVEFLLNNGADPNVRFNPESMTPLEYFCLNGKAPFSKSIKKIITLLLAKTNLSALDTFLNFLKNSSEEYSGMYEELDGLFEDFLSGGRIDMPMEEVNGPPTLANFSSSSVSLSPIGRIEEHNPSLKSVISGVFDS